MRKWLPFCCLDRVPAQRLLSSPALRAQSIENFRWLDLHQPSDVQTIVARALMNEPYTALREIGYIGLPPKETTTAPSQGRRRSGIRREQRRLNTPSYQCRAMHICWSSLRSARILPRFRTMTS